MAEKIGPKTLKIILKYLEIKKLFRNGYAMFQAIQLSVEWPELQCSWMKIDISLWVSIRGVLAPISRVGGLVNIGLTKNTHEQIVLII